jgi:hypothetical protein
VVIYARQRVKRHTDMYAELVQRCENPAKYKDPEKIDEAVWSRIMEFSQDQPFMQSVKTVPLPLPLSSCLHSLAHPSLFLHTAPFPIFRMSLMAFPLPLSPCLYLTRPSFPSSYTLTPSNLAAPLHVFDGGADV